MNKVKNCEIIRQAMDVPIYIISPVAKKALTFANVYAEWLTPAFQDKVYVPEEPFRHHKVGIFGNYDYFVINSWFFWL